MERMKRCFLKFAKKKEMENDYGKDDKVLLEFAINHTSLFALRSSWALYLYAWCLLGKTLACTRSGKQMSI